MSLFTAKEQTPSPVEGAKAEVARLFQLERDLTEKRRQKIAAVVATEEAAVQSAHAGVSAEDAASRIVQEQAEVNLTEQSISVARQRRLAAIRKRFTVEAQEARASAEANRQAAAEIRRKAQPLLKKLSELEGVEFDHSILLAQRNERWIGSAALGMPLTECNPLQAYPDAGADFRIPRSRMLLAEARALDDRARELDDREVRQDGSISKDSIAAILDAEELQDAERLAPAAHEIEKWAARVEAQVRRRQPELLKSEMNGKPRRRQYHIFWREGEIDIYASALSFPGSSAVHGDFAFTEASDGRGL